MRIRIHTHQASCSQTGLIDNAVVRGLFEILESEFDASGCELSLLWTTHR
jgi:hypothetical protein